MNMAPRKLAVDCILFKGPFSSPFDFKYQRCGWLEGLRCWFCPSLKHRHFFYATPIACLSEFMAEMKE
jgi:hypothetical protein